MILIKYKKIDSEFEYPFTTAYGQKTHQSALLISITYNGITGFGEAPAIVYYNVTVDSMIEELLSKIQVLQRYSFTEPDRFWHFCHHLFPTNHFLVCALDIAYWDMYSHFKRKKLYEIWQLEWKNIPLTDYTIGLDDIETMLQKIKQHPMPIYKIKVAERKDIDKLKIIRQHSDAVLRIDANAGWSEEDATALIPELEALKIEIIEQPFARDNMEAVSRFRTLTSIPIIADESCVSENDVKKCAPHFDGINIKLTKCGGITPALRMIKEARALGLQVMMGCMSETEIGTYAIANFLPLLDYVDMDGPLLLKNCSLSKLNYEHGLVSFL